MGRKLGAPPPFREGERGPHVPQCRLGWGLLSYQVASWCIEPFDHNRYGPKIGDGSAPIWRRGSIQPFSHNRYWPKIGGSAPFWGMGAGSPASTMWPRPMTTWMPSFRLIHPTVWPQYINVTNRQTGQTGQTDRTGQDRQRSDSIGRTVLQTAAQKIENWAKCSGLTLVCVVKAGHLDHGLRGS